MFTHEAIMTEAEAVNWAFKQILDPNSSLTKRDPTPAALAVCAAYERALIGGDSAMKLPSHLMCALEMLCKECGR